MKLWLLSQDENNSGYDYYDSCIVSAESRKDAVELLPGLATWENGWASCSKNVQCKYIGEYVNDDSKVILSSFNAG